MPNRLDCPPTLEEWKQWAEDAERNWTDDEIGAHTGARRLRDAANSAVITAGEDVPNPPTRRKEKPAA